MLVQINCPHCGKKVEVKASAAGKRFNCPRCQKRCVVPETRALLPVPIATDINEADILAILGSPPKTGNHSPDSSAPVPTFPHALASGLHGAPPDDHPNDFYRLESTERTTSHFTDQTKHMESLATLDSHSVRLTTLPPSKSQQRRKWINERLRDVIPMHSTLPYWCQGGLVSLYVGFPMWSLGTYFEAFRTHGGHSIPTAIALSILVFVGGVGILALLAAILGKMVTSDVWILEFVAFQLLWLLAPLLAAMALGAVFFCVPGAILGFIIGLFKKDK